MLDNGYSLTHTELLNWGNFHGLHKFTLREVMDLGPLFAPAPATAILGINGSGKSTLIDGLMMALLPFEQSLRLGVTNDAEGGSSGGRTVRDYVLGKYSSTGEAVGEKNLNDVYGRKEGCSIFLLRFQHNRQPEKVLTLGRLWWYQNHKVSETQLAFVHYGTLGISDLCERQNTPKNPKAFREFMKATFPQLQIFDTMQSYFMALSASLGNISKEDLKILNRAFYVKSISQIDNFIRDNMLLEQDSPHLERLLENVRNGQEIASAIQTCNQKIEQIQKILKALDKISEIREKKSTLERERRLLVLHAEWIEIRRGFAQLAEANRTVAAIEFQIPEFEHRLTEQRHELSLLQSQLAKNDLQSRLHQMERDLEHMQERLVFYQRIHQSISEKVKKAGLKMPKDADGWPTFLQAAGEKETAVSKRLQSENLRVEALRQEKFQIEAESLQIKSELEHLSQTKTLISRDLYQLKQEAALALKIPKSHLLFVGELIQVPSSHRKAQRAIESVLFPISKNLLCHPDHLNALTKWLDAKGLRADITVKRITDQELRPRLPDLDWDEDRILGMIELLPRDENPFHDYLQKWLLDTFDYQLVDVAAFKSSEGKLVTLEGLVKTDARTMRKAKQNMPFTLGWDNTDLVASLTVTLVRLQTDYARVTKGIEALTQSLRALEEARLLIQQLRQEKNIEFLQASALETEIQDKRREREGLLKSNPDFHQLKAKVTAAEQDVQGSLTQISEMRARSATSAALALKLQGVLPAQEKELKQSLVYQQLTQALGDASALETQLLALEEKLSKGKITRVSFGADLDQNLALQETMMNRWVASLTMELSQFRRQFNDPNLPYELQLTERFTEFVGAWKEIENRLLQTELPQAQEKWRKFFDQVLMDSVKDTINEIKSKLHEIQKSIESINMVLKLTNFEDLPTDQRYLKIDAQSSQDDRIRKFKRQINEVEKILGPQIRAQVETQSDPIMQTLMPLVEDLQKDVPYRLFVTDVRQHFHFRVHSLRRVEGGGDYIMETFTGSRKDAKSSAQTTQLAYVLLASCLAHRFKFHDVTLGKDTPRLLILDEFGGKFDNEKPKEILRLLDKMGFQSILVSPMSKAELLAENVNQLIFVHKVSASHSKVRSHAIHSRDEYDQLIKKALQTRSLDEAKAAADAETTLAHE